MKSVQELFPEIFALVAKAHEGVHGGHDIYHATRVATWAQKIALNEWGDKRTAELAGLAGLCHNADRLLEIKYGRGKTPDEKIAILLTGWLIDETRVNDEEEILIVKAVLGHNKKNDASHSEV